MSLPRGHSGRAHVEETGHRLALSTMSVSNCAECDWSSERKHHIQVTGVVFNAYLDPSLGTEMALVMDHYYGWATPHGSGLSHHFRAVPHEVCLDLIEDMGNVAYIESSVGEHKTASSMRKVIERIEKVIGFE